MMEKIPWVVRGYVESSLPSDIWFGEQAVYRVSLGNFLFFFGMCLALVGVKDRGDARDALHHSHWGLKFMLWLLLTFAPFLLPNPVINAYAWLARVGSGLFLVVQMVILLDFAAAWNESWVSKDSDTWMYALLAVTVTCYAGSLVTVGLLFHWYRPNSDCHLNATLVSLTLVMAVVFSVVSIHPAVKGGSLMPSSLMCAYCVYLCFSALSSEPTGYACNGLASDSGAVSQSSLVMGMMVTMLSVVYSALRAGSSSSFFQLEDDVPAPGGEAGFSRYTALTPPAHQTTDEDGVPLEPDDEELGPPRAAPRPKGPVAYNYSFFHLIFAFASMYTAMLMTGWGSGTEQADKIDIGWTSVWVKIGSQWVTSALYIWTLVAPIVLPDREF